MGVVKLTYESYSAIEGQTVSVRYVTIFTDILKINISVSRLYGSNSAIEVSGVAKAPLTVPDNTFAADPVIDYPLTTLTVTLNDKVTSGDILIVLPSNSGVNPLKVFDFSLTGLQRINQAGEKGWKRKRNKRVWGKKGRDRKWSMTEQLERGG